MSVSGVPEISIVVANWNGEAFLQEGLASLFASAEAAGRPYELMVVDDASTDGSVALIEERFPQVRLLRNPRNWGFARTSNRGAQASRGRVLVMMNNDIVATLDLVARLVAPFFELPAEGPEIPPVFAVGARTINFHDDAPNHLCMDAVWQRGGIGKVVSDPPALCATTFVQAGAAAYDRELFLTLGGFDEVFSPGYWEDYDISYRAAKAGWRVFYEPAAVARHLGKGSLGQVLGHRGLVRIDERNRLIFNWLNLADSPGLLLCHLALLPLLYVSDVLRRRRGFSTLAGFCMAVGRLGKVSHSHQTRRRSDPPIVRTNREILRRGRAIVTS
jgi:GT2 family glycosyltransferase